MRVIICGCRWIWEYNNIEEAVKLSNFKIDVVISGGQRKWDYKRGKLVGADYLGECYAEQNRIPIERYPANWNKFGRSAGMIRNSEMIKVVDAVIAIWDEKSPGTKDTINKARKKKIPVYVYVINEK